jgi:hypothetical protein
MLKKLRNLKFENLNVEQVYIHIKEIVARGDKWKSDIKPFDNMLKKDKIQYKFEKIKGVWYLGIH